jgi:hypothetical protein
VTRDELLNVALDVELQWGPEMQRPAVDRLRERVPELGAAEAEELLRTAAKASSIIFGFVYDRWDEDRAGELASEGEALLRETHPWVDEANAAHLRSQACYYAWHG